MTTTVRRIIFANVKDCKSAIEQCKAFAELLSVDLARSDYKTRVCLVTGDNERDVNRVANLLENLY